MTDSSVHSLRWFLKKTARRCVAVLSLVTGLFRSSSSFDRTAQVRVLTYHRFGNQPRDPFCVIPKDFEAQMAWLSRRHLAVSLAEVERFLAGKATLAPGSVLVTIDDGYQSVHDIALPILKKYNIPAIAFVTVSAIGNHSAEDNANIEPHMTWEQINALTAAGITVASHGWTHRSLGKMSLADMQHEAMRSRLVLEQNLSRSVTAFAYPFGTLADFNATTATVLKDSGYRFAFTSQHGFISHRAADEFDLPRIKVEGGEGLWMFRQLVYGGLDDWRIIDRTLWQWQQSPEKAAF